MVKCKLELNESVLSTLHRGGEGQNVYKVNFFSRCDQVVGSAVSGSVKGFIGVLGDFNPGLNHRSEC